LQAKLLRALQEGEITPVGDHRPRRIDVRIIAATNRALADESAAGRFRSDLYHRLAAFPIVVPPLRARRDDVPLLIDHFLRSAAARHARAEVRLQPAALALLVRFDWPGNVRELRNEIERAVALAAAGEPIGPELLSPKVAGIAADAPGPLIESAEELQPLRAARTAFETRHLTLALRRHGGNV
jgi:transcriptional regulator with GAF, ATPase, and Fis domain